MVMEGTRLGWASFGEVASSAAKTADAPNPSTTAMITRATKGNERHRAIRSANTYGNRNVAGKPLTIPADVAVPDPWHGTRGTISARLTPKCRLHIRRELFNIHQLKP